MVFLGIVMMPFYYGSKVRSVPEYLRLRFNKPTHLFNALTFAFATVLIAGVNLCALALELMLGWPILLGIVVAAAVVLADTERPTTSTTRSARRSSRLVSASASCSRSGRNGGRRDPPQSAALRPHNRPRPLGTTSKRLPSGARNA